VPESSGDMNRTTSRTLGVLAEPEVTAEFAERNGREVVHLLNLADERHDWSVVIEYQDFSAGNGLAPMLDSMAKHRIRRAWDVMVCLTDLPIRFSGRTVVAEVALGAVNIDRRVRTAVADLGWAMHRHFDPEDDAGEFGPPSLHQSRRIEAAVLDDGPIGFRYVSTTRLGRGRLLAGMLRANRPWRLALGLRSAMAAAIATGAFALVTDTIWQLADLLGAPRLTLLMVLSISSMVFWIITQHDLWESPRRDDTLERYKASLYNTSTVWSLMIGVVISYVLLFVAVLLAAAFTIDDALLAQTLQHPVTAWDFMEVAWMTTSAALIGGALGSGFESKDDILRAAYGQRERHRRQAVDEGE
jgi:low affinity Fe/Cu permease